MIAFSAMTVSFGPSKSQIPWPRFGRATVPATFVPMRLPRISVKYERKSWIRTPRMGVAADDVVAQDRALRLAPDQHAVVPVVHRGVVHREPDDVALHEVAVGAGAADVHPVVRVPRDESCVRRGCSRR
jgi:hypothetical protein